jgi:uncharacterized membrane protein
MSFLASELVNQRWSKPKLKNRAPNVVALINRFNAVAGFVASVIVLQERLNMRARVMAKLIAVAVLLER